MSKEQEHDVLGQLEGVVNDAYSGIKGEWQELQIRLLRESRKMSDDLLSSNDEIKAVLCVGQVITEEQFSDPDDGIKVVGPNQGEYEGIGLGSPVHARMSPAVGVKSALDMYKFLKEKHLVCSLYEATNYVTLFMHAKFKNSELMAMSSPNGVAVLLERKDKPEHSFYLMFDGEGAKNIKKNLGVLSEKQLDIIMELCEAQIVAPKFKESQPKIWAMMIEAIKEYQPNEFLTEGDE